MSIDLKIFYFFNNLAGKKAILDYFFIFLSAYLEYFVVFGFLLFLLLWKKYAKNDKIKISAFIFGSALIARLVVAEIIRFFYYRPRPFLVYDVNQLVNESSSSFPSGHAIFFFALAAGAYAYNKKVGVILLVIAAIISLARIITGVHYPSDILGGFLLGLAIPFLIKKIGRHFLPSD